MKHMIMSRNPIRRIRVAEKMNLHEFAGALGVSYTYLCTLEFGCVDRLPPGILDSLYKYGAFNSETVHQEFTKFQHDLRKHNCKHFRLDISEAVTYRTISPLQGLANFWKLASLTALGRALCVQPSCIYLLRKGSLRSLPGTLEKALREIGISEDDIEELNYKVIEFYEYRRENPSSTPCFPTQEKII